MSLISLRPPGASALRSNQSLRPLNPDLCKSSNPDVVTANKGDPNHEVTFAGPNMADGSEPKPGMRVLHSAAGRAMEAGAARPCSCRLKSLWTVNPGAGLGAVSGAGTSAPRSQPAKPANPEHAPITWRRHIRQRHPRTGRRLPPTTLRRTDSLTSFSPVPVAFSVRYRRDAEWSGSSSQQACC